MECLACVEWPRGILGMRHTRREPPTPSWCPPPRIDVPPSCKPRFVAPGSTQLHQQISGFLHHSIAYFFDITPNISSHVFVSQCSVFCIVFRVLMLHHVADGSVRVPCHHGRVEDGGLAEASHGRPPHALRPPPPRPGHDEGQRQRGGGAQEPHESRDHVLHHHQHGQ